MHNSIDITDSKKDTSSMNSSGSQELAWQNFKRMMEGSQAYQNLIEARLKDLDKNNINELNWQEVPVITKSNFYSAYPWKEVLPKESYKDIYTLYRSSGTTATSSSRGFFWPQLKSDLLRMSPAFRDTIVEIFKLNQKSTLMIVGLSLGSWAGGEQFSFLLKDIALSNDYPLVVFTPGNLHAEIIELIEKCHEEFKQIVIALCPSAIFYLERLAHKLEYKLPLEKITFLVLGEPFPEALRIDLQKRAGEKRQDPVMISLYGAADAGVMGIESSEIVMLRQFIANNPDMALALGFTPYSIPNLFHINSLNSNIYLEQIDDELIITKWQGLPLVRYNLQDKCKIYSWETLCLIAASYDKTQEDYWLKMKSEKVGNVLAIWGRSKGCIFLCGSNIFESMLQEVVLRSSLAPIITGAFVVWVELQMGRQILHWQIELKAGVQEPSYDIHSEFVNLLSQQQPEFSDDYEKFYRPSEDDGLRIFQFHFCKDKTLSDSIPYNTGIKKKIIVENGPIQ